MPLQYELHADLAAPVVLKLAIIDKDLMHFKLQSVVLSCCLGRGADLESFLSFTLLNEHRLQHIIHLLWRGILAVTNPNTSQQNELLHTLLCCSLYQVDVTLNRQPKFITTPQTQTLMVQPVHAGQTLRQKKQDAGLLGNRVDD